jgi:hypothetical protein
MSRLVVPVKAPLVAINEKLNAVLPTEESADWKL